MAYRTTYWFSQHFPLNYQPPSRESNYYGPLVLVPPIPPIPGAGGGGGSSPRAKRAKRIVTGAGVCSLRCNSYGICTVIYEPKVVCAEAVCRVSCYGTGDAASFLPQSFRAQRFQEDDMEVVAVIEAYLKNRRSSPPKISVTFRN